MKLTGTKSYTSPLASRLMQSVFGVYLLIALGLTAVQLTLQFLNEQNRHYVEMEHAATVFNPILARAMWEFNDEQLQAIMLGLVTNPEVSGVIITDIDGLVTQLGDVGKKDLNAALEADASANSPDADASLIPLDSYNSHSISFDIEFNHTDSGLHRVGSATLYSSGNMVVERVWDAVFITFVAACFKTLCLWLIMTFFLKRLVSRPLEKLSALMQHFNPENDQQAVIADTDNKQSADKVSDELGNLENSFVSMTGQITRQQASLQRHNDNLNSIFEALPDSYFRLNQAGVIIGYKTQNSETPFSHTVDFMDQKMVDILPDQVAALFADHFDRYQQTGKKNTWEYSLEINGQSKTYEARLGTITDQQEFVMLVRDVTERKADAELIWYQANMDELTDLPNRNRLLDRLNEEIEKSMRSELPFALLFLDLDQFKEVNDTLGHGVGDELLIEAAKRIKECVREIDFVGRQGGDEFTIILSELSQVAVIDTVSNRILSALSKPFHLGVHVAHISASIGITLFPLNARSASDLLKTADQAMYASKAQGRNCFNYFTPSMQKTAMARMHLDNDLRTAIEQAQFELHYQPIVSLASGRIGKAEALIRWNHPTQGLIMPDDFISLAEETHKIIDIGNWVFSEAVRSVKKLRAVCDKDFQLSINISPVQLSSEDSMAEQWLSCLNREGIPGDAIIGEITEGLMMEADEETIKNILFFAENNLQLAIDDFGTGYSSLSYIRKYDIEYLKIDRSFVTNLTAGSEDYVLCETIIVMSHQLGIQVVAEGIETEEQYQLLRSAGCDFGQGYFIAKPMPMASMLDLVMRDQAIVS